MILSELFADDLAVLAGRLEVAARRRLGRSLALRHVDAGSCNGCELEIHALNNAFYDLERFGLRFVASPRHADGLVVTGPVSRNMEAALRSTYDALAPPRIVIAVGAQAISGGIFRGDPEVRDGVSKLLPVDLYIPGNPPHPLTILDGLMRLMDRLNQRPRGPGGTAPA